MSEENDSIMEFPCEFPIKAFGRQEGEFEALVLTIVNRHVPDLSEGAVVTRPSSKGNYIAVTVTFTATSKRQLDDLYRELTAHEDVLMVL